MPTSYDRPWCSSSRSSALDPDLPLPSYARPGDAGADLVAREGVSLAPGGGRALVPTGIALAIPAGYAGFVQPRSGLAFRHGVTCLNTPGLIDAGYRDELRVLLVNTDPDRALRGAARRPDRPAGDPAGRAGGVPGRHRPARRPSVIAAASGTPVVDGCHERSVTLRRHDPSPAAQRGLGIRFELLRVRAPQRDGLRIPFFHDDEPTSVVAEFTLDDAFSGAPSYVHGGVTLAVLDEAQAWATIAVGGKFAVTTETATRFHRPVHVGRTFTVEASVTGEPEGQICTRAEVRSQSGKVCAETTAVFAVLSEATAVDAIGADLDTIGREHLRD